MATNFLTKLFGSRNDRLLKQYRKTVARINAMEPEYEKLSDEALRGKTQEFKERIAQGETLDEEEAERAAQKAYDAALEALRNSRESFEQGLITSLDLLQAERTERQQESMRRRAELGVWAALFDHRRSLGLPPL